MATMDGNLANLALYLGLVEALARSGTIDKASLVSGITEAAKAVGLDEETNAYVESIKEGFTDRAWKVEAVA